MVQVERSGPTAEMIEPAGDKYKTTTEINIHGRIVPSGFAFDGMSAPWFLRSFVGGPFRPRTVRAVLLHDFLYSSKDTTRKEADIIFRNMLRGNGVRGAWLFYWAVRLFGWMHYGK